MTNGLRATARPGYYNDAMNAEVSYQTTGIGAETSSGGVRLNMIPREGGNRFSGDFKARHRPGAGRRQPDRSAQGRGLTAGNAIDRIVDYTAAQGGPIKKDKLWFFAAARYNSVNNFIANTYMDDGSQGIDDQFIQNGMARLTWQVRPRNKFSALLRRDRQVPRPRHAGQLRSRDRGARCGSRRRITPPRSSGRRRSPAAAPRRPAGRTTPRTTRTVSGRHRAAARHRGVVRQRGARTNWTWAATRGRPDQHHREPGGVLLELRGDVRDRRPHHQDGRQQPAGHLQAHARSPTPTSRSSTAAARTGVRWTVPDSVLIRNTPLVYGERLNQRPRHLHPGLVALNRLTVNGGLRWETLNAQVLAGKSPAGRFVPERTFARSRTCPTGTTSRRASRRSTTCSATPDRAQVLAEPLQPVAHHRHRGELQPAALADR